MPLRTDRLRELREKQGLSQRTLSRLCHLNDYQILRYENGKSDPSATHLEMMAEVLGVSTDYLLGMTDEPQGLAPGTDLNGIEREVLEVFRRKGWNGLLSLVAEHLTKHMESDK